MKAIGVAEFGQFLDGETSLDFAIGAAQVATRQYAKRQYTWFAHQPPANWPRFDRPLDQPDAMDEALALTGDGTGVPVLAWGSAEDRVGFFGPILAVIPVDSLKEAVDIANDTEYGLAASVFTANGSRALRAARALRAGRSAERRAGPDRLCEYSLPGRPDCSARW